MTQFNDRIEPKDFAKMPKEYQSLLTRLQPFIKRMIFETDDQVDFLLWLQRDVVGRTKGPAMLQASAMNLYNNDLLEEAGVIRGYRLDIDPAALGLPIAAYVRVRPNPGQLPTVAELARRIT